MPEIISRQEAKERGLKRYFTGKPCKHGHVEERIVSGKHCVVCASEARRRYHEKNRDTREYKEKHQAKTQRYREKHRDKFREYERERKYGVLVEEQRRRMAEQDQCCAICGLHQKFSRVLELDHCHTTEEGRGFLCRGCNRGLGQFNDDPEALRRAADYVEYWREQHGLVAA